MNNNRPLLIIQSIMFIIFGFLFLSRPIINTFALVLIVGIALAGYGVAIIINGIIKRPKISQKILDVLLGLLFIFFGVVFFITNPVRGAISLVYATLIAIIVFSIAEIGDILRMKSGVKWFLLIVYLAVIGFGIYAIFNPVLALQIFYWTVAIQAFAIGGTLLARAFAEPKEKPPAAA